MVPVSGRSMQASMARSVDLPDPDGPAITVSRWGSTVTSTLSTASTVPAGVVNRRVTPRARATTTGKLPFRRSSCSGTQHLHRSGADHADHADGRHQAERGDGGEGQGR